MSFIDASLPLTQATRDASPVGAAFAVNAVWLPVQAHASTVGSLAAQASRAAFPEVWDAADRKSLRRWM